MKVVRTIAEARAARFGRIALVPTMGAFHEGHLSLMRLARDHGDCVAVSLFVNPTQFGAGEDFEKYPRDEVRDFQLAEAAGVDIMFAPKVEEMYPSHDTTVRVRGVSEQWEGVARPGHFEGVATVVAKLFHIVQPQAALFGWKDFQQCIVIRKMVVDLDFPVKLVFAETIREQDGLAMSSRNAYLTPEQRALAPKLYAELLAMRILLRRGRGLDIDAALQSVKERLTSAAFQLDYLDLVDERTFEPIRANLNHARLILAARIGSTRLIDNLEV